MVKRINPWWVHGAILCTFALLGGCVTVIDLSSSGMLKGVGTFFYWRLYVAVAAGTSIVFLLFHLLLKKVRPWLALGLTYLIPLLVFQVLVVGENLRVHQTKRDRLQQRQDLLDGCIDIIAWEVLPTGGGKCDLILNVRSKVGAVIELRPFYRQWYGHQSVHRLPAGEVAILRRPLELGRLSAVSEWIRRPETSCSAFDFRDFRFVFRCGAAPVVVIGYQSSATPTGAELSLGPAPTVRPLPTSVNERQGGHDDE